MTRSTSIPTAPNAAKASFQGGRGAGGALVSDRDNHAAPAAVIDHDLEVVIAESAPRPRRGGRAAERAVAATVGDPAKLLVVLVDERTPGGRPRVLLPGPPSGGCE